MKNKTEERVEKIDDLVQKCYEQRMLARGKKKKKSTEKAVTSFSFAEGDEIDR